ncbi:MAG: hypothetical protein ACREHF_05120 [Rhizomicrobium sp.]
MNKYLLMSAAAVLASTGAATAGTHSWTFGTAGGGSYCDGGTATTGLSSGVADAWIHTNDECASLTSQGAGLLGKVKGLGKVYGNSDNYLAKFDSIYTEQLEYTLPHKIKQGGQWTLWIGLSGYTSFEGNSGVLNNVTPGAHGIKSHGTTSTAAKVKQLIANR